LSCIDDIVDEVPQQRDYYKNVIEAEQRCLSFERLRSLLRVVVKYLEANRVIVIIPIDLL
jgi:hypothetical protein